MAAEELRDCYTGKRSISETAAIYRQRYDSELRPLFRNAGWLRRLTSIPPVLHRPMMALLRSPRVTRFLMSKTRPIKGF
jgi:hypothetical protein